MFTPHLFLPYFYNKQRMEDEKKKKRNGRIKHDCIFIIRISLPIRTRWSKVLAESRLTPARQLVRDPAVVSVFPIRPPLARARKHVRFLITPLRGEK